MPFECQTRADRVDPELLEVMKAAGCHQIFFGIESGDEESLRRIRKRMPLDRIRQAVRWVKEAGIRCTGFFIVGFPWETEAMMRRTADFACDLGLDAISLFSATPLPGTELWEMGGGDHLPDSIDFTTPQVNLTTLSGPAYRELYERIQSQVEDYNFAQVERRFQRLRGEAGLPPVELERPPRVGWIDGRLSE